MSQMWMGPPSQGQARYHRPPLPRSVSTTSRFPMAVDRSGKLSQGRTSNRWSQSVGAGDFGELQSKIGNQELVQNLNHQQYSNRPYNQVKYRKPKLVLSETRNAFAQSQSAGHSKSETGFTNSGVVRKSNVPFGGNDPSTSSRYDVKLGGVTLERQPVSTIPLLTNGNTSQRRNLIFQSRASESDLRTRVGSGCVNSGDRNNSMVSLAGGGLSRSQISLVEQKKLQWAKEREELSGLWTPWRREANINKTVPNNSDLKSSVPHSYNTISISTPGGHTSQSDCYLPPINSSHGSGHNRNVSNANSNSFGNFGGMGDSERKLSLQENAMRQEQRSIYHREGNAEWIVLDNNNGGENANNGANRGVSPRVIVHKIYMDAAGEQTTSISRTVTASRTPDYSGRAQQNSGGSGSLTRGFYGGSTDYLSKPPPVAMRSSLTIGLNSPRLAGSFDDLEKREREQWLNELEKQREEQRIRKLLDKDDKRARWGDRGIGVGHFWEPSDSSKARLPSREGNGDGGTPPAWLQRSLTQMQGSKSQPNLYNGPLPTDAELNELVASMSMSNSLNVNQQQNHSSIDIRSPQQPHSISPSENPDNSEARTYLRGQNVPIDPNERTEKERKLKANQEHLEAIKNQIEERQRKIKEEKNRQIAEEREHERRMAQQRELELQRLEMERRQRNPQSQNNNSDLNYFQESDNPSIPIQIFESGKGRQQFYAPTDAEGGSQAAKHQYEPPLIPHQVIEAPNAYELEIARRQSILLSSSHRSESTSYSDTDLRLQTPPPNKIQIQNLQTYQSLNNIPNIPRKVDECLMTDSDHIYERTLTPTKERRSRSMETNRSREFGTQTEISDADTDLEKSRHSRSKSNQNLKKLEEKPRWGANPVKKVYLKQSEKDPNYQDRLRKKTEMMSSGFGGETDESEDLPFHRIQNRAKARSRKSPLKAFQSSSHVRSHNHLKTDTDIETDNYHSVDRVNRKNSSMNKSSLKTNNSIDNDGCNSANLSVAQRHLGHITSSMGPGRSGLNSVGGSEESGTGSEFTSPSLLRRGTTGETTGENYSNSGSVPSSASLDYVPLYSKEFVSQQDFDEQPINAGKMDSNLESAFVESRLYQANAPQIAPHNSLSNAGIRSRRTSPQKGIVAKKPVTKVKKSSPPTKLNPTANKNPKAFRTNQSKSIIPEEEVGLPNQVRNQSPPVPALQKKMQMGFHPDESGRLSSLPTELLSPVPNIPIGSIPLHISNVNSLDPGFDFDISRLSSAEPKVDIDIAITHASNPDLQRILSSFESMDSGRSKTTEDSNITLTSDRLREELKLPDILSGRSIISDVSQFSRDSRPMTHNTDLSLKVQEDFIRELLNHKEVQEQLSARQSELSERGIIEFNVRLPSSWSHSTRSNSKSKSGRNSRKEKENLEEYRDPLASDRRKATAQWLHSLEEPSPRDALLTNLSSLKQGIKMQQRELIQTADRDL